MRATRRALADALRVSDAVTRLVPPAQIYAVERSTIPTLPSVEVIGLTSERVGDGPLVRHEVAIEVTVRHPAEDAADEALDAIVLAVWERVGAAERDLMPIALASGEGVRPVLGSTRWSINAADQSSIVRGASIALSVEVAE